MMRIFNSHGADSKMRKYDGCLCEIERKATADEVDIEDVGEMYHVRFADGYRTMAFEDELEGN